MSVLKKYFNKKSYASPVMDDYDRVVRYDEDGNEIISYEKVDYPSLVDSRGTIGVWKLNALLAAGIDPNFNIHTGFNSRIEGVDTVNDALAYTDQLFAEDNNVSEDKE